MKLSKARRLAALLVMGATGTAQAHMPYVLPMQFDVGSASHVTVQSAFAEDAFMPEVAMRDAPFHLVGPDGKRIEPASVAYLRDLSVFDADLKAEGTYRVTTGQRLGRMGKMFKAGDKWVMRGEGQEPAPGAAEVDVQSTTLAEAYITKGQASEGALAPRGQGLELQPLSHPNAIVAGSDVSFVLVFNGQPLADADVTMFRSAGVYDGRKVAGQVRSDTSGRFTLTPQDAGTYLILVRHRAAAPAGSETPWRSYTYTLAFDAA